MWTDLKISNEMRVLSQDVALVRGSPLLRESLSARLLMKNLRSFPIPPFGPKTWGGGGGGKRSHFHVNNSLLASDELIK